MFKLLYDHWHSGGALHVDAVVLLALLKGESQQHRKVSGSRSKKGSF